MKVVQAGGFSEITRCLKNERFYQDRVHKIINPRKQQLFCNLKKNIL